MFVEITTRISERERMKFLDDLVWDSLADDSKPLPVTPDQRVELDSRLTAYEGDKNRGQLAGDVLADLRRRL